jgi:acetyl-CoA synthetase
MGDIKEFLAARDLLLAHREDYGRARRDFRWPRPEQFNWALDYFDGIQPRDARALWVIHDNGAEETRTFAELTVRSNQVANFLRSLGLRRGDRLLLMLGNEAPLWELMLAAMKLGVVVIPASLLLGPDDLTDRLDRGGVRAVVAAAEVADRFAGLAGGDIRVAVGGDVTGWHAFTDADTAAPEFEPDGPTAADDPLLLYFTSGTTSKPKLVEHSHLSYPVGHLSTMYWIGLQPGDVHLNISSPGWAKHAWSNVYAPWNAQATVLVVNYARFSAETLLEVLSRCTVTTLCAPPTVWRMLIQADLAAHDVSLRELASAGEPLNPEVIDQVAKAWNLPIRDGFGQTETTAQIANSPGQPLKPGSMGRPLPGYDVVLLDAEGHPGDEGELSLDLTDAPVGLMRGYCDDDQRSAEAFHGGFYRTGDIAARNADGYITYVGRADDVFKSSDYRISPFELESALIEHPAVAECAVVPSPDRMRLAVPKAFIVLAPGHEPSPELAEDIFGFCRTRLSAYQRIRLLEFADLPKTISGKIRRVELRQLEERRAAREPDTEGHPHEYRDRDFPPGQRLS